MSQISDFGDTISKGIQDVAALLPLLGTNQCEHHVGAALEKGYIYAAATPLSIFGSLGIVKAAFATLLACTTKVFFGGKWFHHAGFGTTDSVISMATLVRGTKRYGAEVKLQQLLKEQHLDDPELISDIEYFGWEKRTLHSTSSPRSKSIFSAPWTFALIVASTLSSILSLTPYIYLNHNEWNKPLSWIFPVCRSFGSLICVVSVQLALQLRIHHIVQSSLILMKARKHSLLAEFEDINRKPALMEERLRALHDQLAVYGAGRDQGQEKGKDGPETWNTNKVRKDLESVLSVDIMLLFHQASILVGIVMIVVGYIGCFNLVSKSKAEKAPYVWLGMEAFLSVLRIALWGGNPSWAQGDTGLEMRLELLGTKPSKTTPSTPSTFPLVTTSHPLSQLTKCKTFGALGTQKESAESVESFVAVSTEDFLAAATPYVGPLRRLELEGISLFHAIVPETHSSGKRKLLCLTARRDDSDWAAISIFIHGSKTPYRAFTSRSQGLRGSRSRSLQVTLEDKLDTSGSDLGSTAYIDNISYQHLVQYSYDLFRRLFMRMQSSSVDVLWTLTLPSSLVTGDEIVDVALSKFDEDYTLLRKLDDSKAKWGTGNHTLKPYAFIRADASQNKGSQLIEYGALFESALLEIHLCIEDHCFVRNMGLSPAASRPLSWEWIRKMRERILAEKKHCHKRLADQHSDSIDLEETWDTLFRELRTLRQMHVSNPLLRSWEGHIRDISDSLSDKVPLVSELFNLQPFPALKHLTSNLLPLFTEGEEKEDYAVQSYRKMISRVGTAILRLPDDVLQVSAPHKFVREVSEKTLVGSDNDLGLEDLDQTSYVSKDHGGGSRVTLPNSGDKIFVTDPHLVPEPEALPILS